MDRRRFLKSAAFSVAAPSLLSPENALSVTPHDPAQTGPLPQQFSLNGAWGFRPKPADPATIVLAHGYSVIATPY